MGPAIVRGLVVTVDGVERRNSIGVLHAILGPNIVSRSKRGELSRLMVSGVTPGSVLRSGQTIELFALDSKRYATPLLRAAGRIDFRTCYCALIPGKCWIGDSGSSRDPKPVGDCAEDPHDLLHASAIDTLFNKHF